MSPLAESKEALIPEYACDVNEPIALYEGEATLVANGEEVPGESVLRFAWQPVQGPEVIFRPPVRLSLDDELELRIPRIGLVARARPRRITGGAGDPKVVAVLLGQVATGNPGALSRMKFHIGNFPWVYGGRIHRQTTQVMGRIHLDAAPWVIDIDPMPDEHAFGEPDLPDRISEERGFGLTHVGQIARVDGMAFSDSEAAEVLKDLGRTFSFARAAFSTPFLRIGYDATGAVVWKDWFAYRTDAWSSNETWFSRLRPQILQSVFSGWRRLSRDANFEVFSAALHLFVDAHAPTLAMESKLVLAQSALEGLAEGWPYPALPGAPPLPPLRGQPTAARRIAEMALSLGIPTDAPASMPHLRDLQQPGTTALVQEKMTWVRNSIAHLDKFPRLVGHPWQVKFEAWQLAAWHLELALLKVLDANGLYQNRLVARTQHDTERLPWAP